MKALITAGGKGTRMRPLTFSTNKNFLPVANKPLLFYAIETLAELGIKEIGVNYNPYQLEEIKSYLGDGRKWGVRFTFILQEEPLGLAHIIKVAEPFFKKDKFVMHLGDNIFYGGIKSLMDYFLNEKLNALAPVVHHRENWRLGVPYFDKKGKLIKYVEKPKDPPHDLAVPGLYFFDHHVFECFSGKKAIKPSARGELEISAVYQWLIDKKYNVGTKEFKGFWKDPGKFDDWLDTNQFILDATLKNNSIKCFDKSVRIEGRVKIGKKSRIKNSCLRGPIIIGDGVIIKDSFIGPYSSIGDGCQIINAKLENTVLMKNVQLKHPEKTLDSCMIGENSLIEGNSQHKNGMELFIGSQCVVKF